MKFIALLKRLKRKILPLNNEDFIAELQAGGAQIGEGVYFFGPKNCTIDQTRPWLLTIGAYSKITQGVTILTHDYSCSVLRRIYGEWIGEGAEVKIGENCFIGMNATLLMGTMLGNNVIVGAGSVVHGTFPDNVVIAGNPAKIIYTLEEHYLNRKNKTKEEALACAKRYHEVFGIAPKPKDMAGFKFLFMPRSNEILKRYELNFQCNGDNPEEVEEAFFKTAPIWPSFESFLEDAGISETK